MSLLLPLLLLPLRLWLLLLLLLLSAVLLPGRCRRLRALRAAVRWSCLTLPPVLPPCL